MLESSRRSCAPTSEDPREPAPDVEAARPHSRRNFLRGSAMAGAAAVPGLILGAPSRGSARPPNLHVAARLIREIRDDETAHVAILQQLLTDTDNPFQQIFPGTAFLPPGVRPMPVLRNLRQPTVESFLETASAFENTGSGTYGGALFAIQQTEEYFPIAVGLTTVESRHASYLNALLGESLVPDFAPVEAPIPQEVTLARVDPFIAHLNGPIPSFDPLSSSDENNFAILDFLLLLEYIESAFYRINVAHFFP